MRAPQLVQVQKLLNNLSAKLFVAICGVTLLTLLADLLAPGSRTIDLADPIPFVLVMGTCSIAALALAPPMLFVAEETLQKHVRADVSWAFGPAGTEGRSC